MPHTTRRQGPLLALALVGFIAAVGALIAGLAVGSQALQGVCMLILGGGILFAREEVAEVWAGLNFGPPNGGWVDAAFVGLVLLIGAGLMIGGAVVLGEASV